MDSQRIRALVWGADNRESEPPRENLTMERILDAVVEIATADGVAAVSMSRVAKQIGYTPMAIYRHLPNKAMMMEVAVDHALGPPPETLLDTADWRQGLHHYARGLAGRYRVHPWTLDVRVSGPPILPNTVRWMEVGLRILSDSGVGATEQIGLLTLLTGFVRGFAQMFGGAMDQPVQTDQPGYGDELLELTTPAEFPALTMVIASGVFDDGGKPAEPDEFAAELQFGVDLIIAGIEFKVSDAVGR
ncbi:MAG: TetR/AcrR family transcriptional regulator [Thermomicrobiales bacterium]|nr:TetR/AcrR family transcriptional regulator [Thermomicrobiales bacterium]